MNYAVRLMHTLRWVGIAGVILGGTSARGSEIANPAAREALVLSERLMGCLLGPREDIGQRPRARRKSRAGGTQDASAHFAVFCNLGKRLQIEQHRLWLLAGLNELNRARRELDVALELAPEYPAALAAKGEILAELPRFLGGDAREGGASLRRAVGLAPTILRYGSCWLASYAPRASMRKLGCMRRSRSISLNAPDRRLRWTTCARSWPA